MLLDLNVISCQHFQNLLYFLLFDMFLCFLTWKNKHISFTSLYPYLAITLFVSVHLAKPLYAEITDTVLSLLKYLKYI